jgi:5,5'-dehydrodivanillate O-demethylase
LDPAADYVPTHLKVEFEEFEHGFIYKRLREGESDDHPQWTIGRVSLWPNGFYLGHHCEWRVPIDDENTLNVLWVFGRVPKEQEPYEQTAIPAWYGPLHDEDGNWIKSHIANQDFAMWVGQGRISDRSTETLGASDRGVVMMRRRFLEELEAVGKGMQPKGLITDPGKNHDVFLPSVVRDELVEGLPRKEQTAHQLLGPYLLDNPQQYGQPVAVREAYEAAIGSKLQGAANFVVNVPLGDVNNHDIDAATSQRS